VKASTPTARMISSGLLSSTVMLIFMVGGYSSQLLSCGARARRVRVALELASLAGPKIQVTNS
jgi:hypothetical protein